MRMDRSCGYSREPMPTLPRDSREEMLAHYRRRNSRLYRRLRAPLPLVHERSERGLPPCDGVKLWIGGAGCPVPADFINFDFEPFSGVQVCGDARQLPFRDGSIAAIECDAVLEHVAKPEMAVAEMVRVLRPGGFLHIVVPFNQAFHAYPSDYQRWTLAGLKEMLPAAELRVVELGIRTGPTATMLSYFCEYCRILAPARLGKLAYAAANWIVWPLRYLDRWLNRKPNAHILANSIYILAQKKQSGEV